MTAVLPTRIGISAYDLPAAELIDLARAADEVGFDSLWLGEHVIHPQAFTSTHPGDEVAQHHDGPLVHEHTRLLDPFVALAAVASVTRRIRLATGILVLPLRDPLLVARAAASLAEVSRERFVLGVGGGWLAEEFAALGIAFGSRGRRLDESVAVLRATFAGGVVQHRGEHFDFGPLVLTSTPVRVPIIVGGNSEIALRRAAHVGDGWFSSGTPDLAESVRLRDRLCALRREAGREDTPFETVVRVEGADPQELARYSAAGFDHVVVWADQVWPSTGSYDAKREHLAASALASVASPARSAPTCGTRHR